MGNYVQLNNIFLKYETLSIKDFGMSNIWVEYHLPDELDVFRRNGATEEWIYKYIFTYEEEHHGSGTIYYTIIGDIFYHKKEFVNIKSIMVINEKFYYRGYQVIVKTNKREPKVFRFLLNSRSRTLFYLTDLFELENKRVFKSIENDIQEEINSIYIFTEGNYKSLIQPMAIFTLGGVTFSSILE